MTDTPPLQSEKPHPSPRAEDKIHERPEVKPLVDKAGAERDARVPQGTMKTGADIVGGGGTKTLEEPANPAKTPPPTDAPHE